ncbi:hypothetical protein C8J56DRAFT_925141 [Mycena floridula]|nr:hypothetical protein C8J56DRAFT_925141 [Mycena floridula]
MSVLTRRAALAQKSILNVLPNELTAEIISLCDSPSQAMLCRVSKHFKQLAQRPLYQIVDLATVTAARVISFDIALSANPQYGAWVRNLDITAYCVDQIQDKFTRILGSVPDLLQLTVDWAAAPALEKSTFPHLRILTINNIRSASHYEPLITAFLNRHPTISHLAVSWGPLNPWPKTMRIDLPNLTVFRGDLNILGCAPKLLSVYFIPSTPADSDVFARFPNCQDLHIFMSTQFTKQYHVQDIFKRLPLPHLKSCMLIDLYTNYRPSELESILAGDFACLEELESLCLVLYTVADYDHASTIGSWVKSRPSLQEGALLSKIEVNLLCRHLNVSFAVSLLHEDAAGRYKIVDGQLRPTTEPCCSERIFSKRF